MFERFTKSAKAAVTCAVEEAERRGDRHIGTEHLLLGIARSDSPVVAEALNDAGLGHISLREALDDLDRSSLAAVGIDVEAALGASPTAPTGGARQRRSKGHRPFTRGAKQVLVGALTEAKALRSRRLDSEHILLALTSRPRRDPSVQLLEGLDIAPGSLRSAVMERIQREDGSARGPATG